MDRPRIDLSKEKKRSDARKWWLLLGGFIAFIVAFDLLESFFHTEPAPAATGETAPSHRAPEVLRLDDGAVEIRHDMFRRTTIRLSDEGQQQALFDCLEQRIDQTFGEETPDWSRRRVRRETQRILDECMGPLHPLPRPPRPDN